MNSLSLSLSLFLFFPSFFLLVLRLILDIRKVEGLH